LGGGGGGGGGVSKKRTDLTRREKYIVERREIRSVRRRQKFAWGRYKSFRRKKDLISNKRDVVERKIIGPTTQGK